MKLEAMRLNVTKEIEFRRINSTAEIEFRKIDFENRRMASQQKIAVMICISIIFVGVSVGKGSDNVGTVLKKIADDLGNVWNRNNMSNKIIYFITGLFAVALGLVGNIVKTFLFWKR